MLCDKKRPISGLADPDEAAETNFRANFGKETIAGVCRRLKWALYYNVQADSGVLRLAQACSGMLRLKQQLLTSTD